LGLDEVGVDFWAECGAERGHEGSQTVKRSFASRYTAPPIAPANVMYARMVPIIALMRSCECTALQTLAVARLVLCHAQNSIGPKPDGRCGTGIRHWGRGVGRCYESLSSGRISRVMVVTMSIGSAGLDTTMSAGHASL